MIFRLVEHCPLCGNKHFRRHVKYIPVERTIQKTGIDEIIYVICKCGLIFQLWPMTQKTLAEYYKYQYREILGAPEVTKANIWEETKRADRLIKFLNGNPDNVLDIGSSTGILLNKLRNKYKCNIVGVEPGDKFREYSQNLGLNALRGIEDLNGNQQFDLITIIHTLEHLVEPMTLLEKAHGLMAKSGKLIIEVPLLDYRLPHPIVFTEETFKIMLNKAGFVMDRIIVDKYAIAEAH